MQGIDGKQTDRSQVQTEAKTQERAAQKVQGQGLQGVQGAGQVSDNSFAMWLIRC